ncbi:excinuclease ABC subunit UvrB [Akkermansiaceae bacterium]|nr:excinuclease ABC subunit UvrB [Akkermansiaceae bacterium]MDA7875477.1 excinuclease ABC subunit UvrB [Akkermansiaceae bacterium]MDA7895429.1 excinuclease ABC subunit UvrB [Akkermansiaceae bacterium]MDB4446437.1 excinuclease ABC subunit UvrB [Akkermansiaceae bacterium]MDB4550444.1 excinuclease ABC subunit UvrB [Akkermansiaceae bacterium]
MDFRLVSEFAPKGDQEQAIAKLVKSIESGNRHQTLRGVTGSGKTFTMANVINQIQKPTLIMSHNKTLAAQLYSEFKAFFPENAVEYFVSYFDYYQPEAYIPRSDTYIEKDSSINEEIERLRLSTMGSLITRDDVIVVASVSCIYGLGNPEDYKEMMFGIRQGEEIGRDEFLTELVNLLFERNDISFERGHFRVRGDVVEVRPAYLEETAIRIEFFGDEIDRITSIDTRSGHVIDEVTHYVFYPAKQFVSSKEKLKGAMVAIRQELDDRIAWFEKNGKLIEAQRIRMRTEYDLEMMQEMGFCQGIENYSRHITGRKPGERPYTLLDFFPDDYLLLADESHATLPQVRGMFEGDKSRKSVLVDHGFRLPSAMDNRPLRFDEYMKMTKRRLYVSATPGPFEIVNSRPDNPKFIPIKSRNESDFDPTFFKRLTIKASGASEKPEDFDISRSGGQLIVEQIIRPTGLLDPILTMRPLKSQIDETIELCQQRVEKDERVLITTLTKKTAEDLTEYLQGVDLKVRYIHADVDAIERVEILRALRAAEFDILVGINLLREGLDLPEVSLVCILDADKEGFLRNETSLIQTAGRAARHINGECVLFCDIVTDSIQCLLDVTEYRRRIQREHNEEHGITPKSVKRAVQKSLHDRGASHQAAKEVNTSLVAEDEMIFNAVEVIREMEDEMQKASAKLEFEKAAHLRDQIKELKQRAGIEAPPPKRKAKVKYNLARKIENDD